MNDEIELVARVPVTKRSPVMVTVPEIVAVCFAEADPTNATAIMRPTTTNKSRIFIALSFWDSSHPGNYQDAISIIAYFKVEVNSMIKY